MQEWAEAEEGVGLPLQCVMDVLANIYNTDAPALLDCARRSLVPLIRQGRRGPSIDADAFLLVMVNEFVGGGWQATLQFWVLFGSFVFMGGGKGYEEGRALCCDPG